MADTRAEISRITLPNNNTYYFKDEVARNLITSNGSFRIAWNGTGTPTAANIPAGIVVNGVTGTLAAAESTLKDFYLVHSSTQIGQDIYDEYVTVDNGASATPRYTWEKIGDTQIQLSEVVTNVTLNKATATVVTGYNSPTTASVIGANSTFTITQPTITVTPTTTYLQASASGGGVGYNSKATATVITGYTPESDTFVTSVTATKNQKMDTITITGVSGSVTASKATAATSQTSVSGFAANSTTNAIFKGWTVSDENLTISGVLPTTQTTTQFTFADVTVPKAASSTTVAVGTLSTAGTGDAVVTAINSSSTAALIDLGTSTTAEVLGSATTFKLSSNQTISLTAVATSGTGKVQVATGINSAAATGGNVAWNNKDAKTTVTGLGTPSTTTALTNSTTITVTKAL